MWLVSLAGTALLYTGLRKWPDAEWIVATVGFSVVFGIGLPGAFILESALARRADRPKRRGPPLRGLVAMADWVLLLPTRKKVKALAGDYAVEIRRLRRAHRPRAAAWNSALAWLTAIQIVLRAPVEWAIRTLLKLLRGA